MSRARFQAATAWLNDLAEIVAGGDEVPDTRKAGIAGLLAEEYPDAVFCRATLVLVAKQSKFFPTFAELCAILSPWWQANRPPPAPQLSYAERNSAERDRLVAAEAERSWQDVAPEEVRRKVRALDGHPMRAQLGKMLASAVRQYAPTQLAQLPPEFLNEPPAGDVVAFPA